MPLLLKREEVDGLIDLSKAIELTEAAYRQQAEGKATAHAPYHIHVGGEGAVRVLSGALLGTRRALVRLGPSYGLGGDQMHALLIDTETGKLLSLMSYPFGTLRTAATVAVAARYLLREDAQEAGLFGIGRNALGILEGIQFVRPMKRIAVYGRDVARTKSFCERAALVLRTEVVPAEKPERAVRQVDLVLTATNSASALFPAGWITPGTHVCGIGKPAEIADSVFLEADHIVVGSKEHEREYYDRSAIRPLVELTEAGKLGWDEIRELGEIVSGQWAGRSDSQEITLFKDSQGGFGDVTFASWVFAEALRLGLGREQEL